MCDCEGSQWVKCLVLMTSQTCSLNHFGGGGDPHERVLKIVKCSITLMSGRADYSTSPSAGSESTMGVTMGCDLDKS